MNFLKALVLAIHESKELNGWPEGCESVIHDNNYEVEFEGSSYIGKDYNGNDREYPHAVNIEGYGLPYIEEYCEGDTVTREEYEAFVAANPNFYEQVQQAKQVNVAKIAELNKEVGKLINEITTLAEEAGIDIYINLGQHGSLDPNSDWDSSRC